MHIDILSVTIRGGLNAVRGPVSVAVAAVKDYVDDHPFSMLYICGNRSAVLDHLRGEFDVRRAFTAYQLFSILEDVYQDVVFIEHDPILYEDAEDAENLVEALSLAMRDVARGRLIIYFSTSGDAYFDTIARNSERVFLFEEEPGGYFIAASEGQSCRKFYHRFLPKGQTTLEAF
jgi:hypothetical protein